MLPVTSGQSNLTYGRIAAAHKSYSPGGTNVHPIYRKPKNGWPESKLDAINSGSWYHCLPIGIYHWLGQGGCIAVVCEVGVRSLSVHDSFGTKGWTVSVHDDFGTYAINFRTCFCSSTSVHAKYHFGTSLCRYRYTARERASFYAQGLQILLC